MNSKLRFGVIGCGRMGLRRMQTIVAHPTTELVGVADSTESLAVKASKEYGCPHFTKFEDLLKLPLDGVILSVPNKLHAKIAVAALNSKKHVFCEKPLAPTVEEATQMTEAAEKNGVTLKTGSNLRYFPNVAKAKELLEEKAIGNLLFLRAWIGHQGWTSNTWFTDQGLSGGGTFLDNGSHLLDIIRWFMGNPESCVGMTKTALLPISPLEDNGVGLFDMGNGRMAMLHSSWTEWNGYMYMEIYGTSGAIRIDTRGKACKTTLQNKEGGEKEFDFSTTPANSYQMEFENYISALLSRKQPAASGEDGAWAVKMAHAVYESSRTGQRVLFKPVQENQKRLKKAA
jgi:predicted dehydrogenase